MIKMKTITIHVRCTVKWESTNDLITITLLLSVHLSVSLSLSLSLCLFLVSCVRGRDIFVHRLLSFLLDNTLLHSTEIK